MTDIEKLKLLKSKVHALQGEIEISYQQALKITNEADENSRTFDYIHNDLYTAEELIDLLASK